MRAFLTWQLGNFRYFKA